MNRIIKELRASAPQWDDLREQRVFAGILAEKHLAEKGRPRPRRFAVVSASAAVIIAVAVVSHLITKQGMVAKNEAPRFRASPGETIAAPPLSTLQLTDIGKARLFPDAEVSLDLESDEQIVVSQNRGKVRFEIEKQKSREFTVHALSMTIRVVGTVFTVEITEEEISVDVEEGIVRIQNSRRDLEIHAGERIVERIDAAPDDAVSHDATFDAPPPVDEVEASTLRRAAGSEIISPPSGKKTLSVSSHPADRSAQEIAKTKKADLKNTLKEVDIARRRGELNRAVTLLSDLVEHSEDPQMTATALFTLGNVERARGFHNLAAEAYERCWKAAPQGPLAEDAAAESADAWYRTGDLKTAEQAAKSYLDYYPDGIHAARMRYLTK